MATLTPKNPVFIYSDLRDRMPIEERLVDGSATYKAGQFLYGAADGLIYAAASDATTIHYLAVADLDSAIGADTTYKRMARISASDVFEMFELDGTIAEADTGERRALDVTSNLCTLDNDDTGNDAFIVVAPVWRAEKFVNTSADVKARVLASVLDSVANAEPA